MCIITATEFKTNFGKYMLLAQKEPMVVTHRGKEIFSTTPKNNPLLQRAEEFFGTLPADIDLDDIDRE